jgi:hypothetical protein
VALAGLAGLLVVVHSVVLRRGVQAVTGGDWGYYLHAGVAMQAVLFACLRIAGVVTSAVARLATDLAGYSLVGRVSHPLDDVPNFMNSACSLLSDQPCLVAAVHPIYSFGPCEHCLIGLDRQRAYDQL